MLVSFYLNMLSKPNDGEFAARYIAGICLDNHCHRCPKLFLSAMHVNSKGFPVFLWTGHNAQLESIVVL